MARTIAERLIDVELALVRIADRLAEPATLDPAWLEAEARKALLELQRALHELS